MKVYEDLKVSGNVQDISFDPDEIAGQGFGVYSDKDGNRVLTADILVARLGAKFRELKVHQTEYMGGGFIYSLAGITLLSVEQTDSSYICYFDVAAGVNKFKVGDGAFCQRYAESGYRYWWMRVISVGENYIEVSKTDRDGGRYYPAAMDVVIQLGHQSDPGRQNAIAISTEGDDAPSLVIYSGIDGFSLSGKNIGGWKYDQNNKNILFYGFGDLLFGDSSGKGHFIAFDKSTGRFRINADVIFGSDSSGLKNLEDWKTLESDLGGLVSTTKNLQDQIDGVVESWSGKGKPTTSNYPASQWIDGDNNVAALAHINDTYVNISSYEEDADAGKAWRWCECGESVSTDYTEILATAIPSRDWYVIGELDPLKPYSRIESYIGDALQVSADMDRETEILVHSGPNVYIKISNNIVSILDERNRFGGSTILELRFYYEDYITAEDADGNVYTLHWHPIADSDAVKALKEAAEAKASIADVREDVTDMQYLRNVFGKGSTEVSGGVVMTQAVAVKDEDGAIESMLNGSDDFKDADHGKVILAGGIPAQTESGDSKFANRVNEAKTRIFEDGWIDATGGKLELMEVNSLRGMVSQIDPTAYLGNEPWYIKEFYQYNGKPNSPDDILMGDSNTFPAKDPSPGSFVPGWDAEPDLAWGKEQIGRRRMFVNHKNASGFSRDYIILNAPQGNTGTTLIGLNTPYFYENGVPSKQLRIEANECVELYGYGFYKSEDKSDWEFMGWIVTNRTNLFSAFSQSLPHGMFAGLRPAFRQVTSSYETLTKYDHTIECFGDGTTINLSLPSSPEVGQCYEIWKWGTCTVYVRSDSKTIARLGVATNLDTLGLDPSYIGVIKLVYDGTKWLATLHRTE